MTRHGRSLHIFSQILPLFLALSTLLANVCRADGTVVVVTKTVAPSVVTQTPYVDNNSYSSESEFKAGVLNSTNFYRRQHKAKAVTWNETLADYAAHWASFCKWEHSGGPYGENLASNYQNITAAIEGWGEEQKDYDFSDGGFGEDTGHFTQLVWRDTRSVGCGRKQCGQAQDSDTEEGHAYGWYVVCEYYPPGNVEGEYQQEVKPGKGAAAGRLWPERGAVAFGTAAILSVVLLI